MKRQSVITGKRPVRRVQPSIHTVTAWWAEHPGVFDVARPECFRCTIPGHLISLQRAHLVDRIRGGLDHEANLAVLCHYCHVQMPSFGNGQWIDAVTWIRTTISVAELLDRRAHFEQKRDAYEAARIGCPLLGPTDSFDEAITATDVAISALLRTGERSA